MTRHNGSTWRAATLAAVIAYGAVSGCSRDYAKAGAITSPDTTIVLTSSPVVSVSIVSPISAMATGVSLTFTAAVTDENRQPLSDRAVTWTSSNAAVATVRSTGNLASVVTATGPGRVTILATLDGRKGGADVTVWAEQAFIYSEAAGLVAIPLPPGVIRSFARAINDLGQVVGDMTFFGGAQHAFLWSAAEGTIDLGPLPGAATSAYGAAATAINNTGQVAGWGGSGTGEVHAFLWSQSAGMKDLGKLPGALHSFASGINSLGQVVGENWTTGGVRPFLWTAERGMELLGSLTDANARATAINDAGDIVGSVIPTGDSYGLDWMGGVLWRASGARVDIMSCIGQMDCGAYAINQAGVITGRSERGPWLWTPQTGFKLFGSTSGGEGDAINNDAQIAGTAYEGDAKAFIWSETGGRRDIPFLPFKSFMQTTGINNRGQVVGYGW